MATEEELRDLIPESIAHWAKLADEQLDTPPGRARRETYRRTAEALRIEQRTGVAVCTCCHKPFSRGLGIPGVK